MKRALVIFVYMFCCSLLFAATPDKIDGGDGIYHLALANARMLRMTIYAITLVSEDGSTVAELFYNASGQEVDLVTNSDYTSMASGAQIPDGTYTELRLYTSYTIGLKGYVHYQYDGYVDEPGKYFYTKSGSTHEDILGQTDLMADSGFPDPADYNVGNLVMEAGELDDPAYPASAYPYKNIDGIVYRRALDSPISVSGADSVSFQISMGVQNGLEFNDAESENSEVVGPPTNIHFNAPDFNLTSN